VALVSIAVLAAGGLFALAVGLFFTRSAAGHEKLRELLLPVARRAVRGGSLYIGHLSGNFLTGFTVDSVAIRDKRGDLFLSTGRLSVAYNPRDLIDYRIAVLHAEVEHPYVHLIQHETGVWNFQEIFASPPERRLPRAPDLNTRGWGDYLVFDSTRTRDGSFVLTMPWHPDDTLHGAVRDSVIKAVLANRVKPVVRTADGFAKTWSWTDAHGLITHVRLADPDSDKRFGQQFDIGELAVLEHDPPFDFHHVGGTVRHLGDSVWINVPHFDLPASTGSGSGKIVWGSDRPVRYDLAIHGDSVALNDVSWVYATLPRTGGGSTDLSITTDPRNFDVLDFALSNMNVTTTKSHVTGAMTFGVGGPVLQVQNVDLRADPVDFALLRTLNGKPFPEDWQGRLIGTVRGPGGPLTHFKVDDARGQFEDAHVAGAVSRFSGNGELDILDPGLTAFHDFHVDAGAIDLRSIEYLFPDVPRLHGIVSGTATLDSSWLDVRVRDAQLTHQDGPGDPSRVSGGGRITWSDKYLTYDLALNAEPLSLPMLARSFPFLAPLHGAMSGPITLAGQTPNLSLSLSLAGGAGAVSYDGRADLDSAGGYGAHGHGDFSALSLDRLLGRTDIPIGALSGHYDVDAGGASAATLVGSAGVTLERTTVDSIRVNPSYAHVRFADGRVLVDSLRVGSVAGRLVATGGIGLPGGRPDSLHFSMDVDSIGGWRRLPFIASTDTTLAGEPVVDSLSGSARLDGVATGRLDSLALNGTVLGSNIYVNRDRGVSLVDTFALRNVTTALTGWTRLRIDTVTLAAVDLDTAVFRLDLDDLTHRRFSVGAHSLTGPTLAAAARLRQHRPAPRLAAAAQPRFGIRVAGRGRARLGRGVRAAARRARAAARLERLRAVARHGHRRRRVARHGDGH
jgi:translocation and assembly module TamB